MLFKLLPIFVNYSFPQFFNKIEKCSIQLLSNQKFVSINYKNSNRSTSTNQNLKLHKNSLNCNNFPTITLFVVAIQIMSGIEPINPKPVGHVFQNDDIKIDYNGIPSQALDAIRMRLAQLTHSLKRIRDELSKPDLPQRYSLQSQLNITLQQLLSVTSTLEHFHETLDSTIIYPLPQFPTTSHENLLTTLLRKKYTPEVDQWLRESREAAEIDNRWLTESKIKEVLKTDKDITEWALQVFSKEYEKYSARIKPDVHLDDSRMNVDEEDRYNHYKPTKPFEVEKILSYTFRGEL